MRKTIALIVYILCFQLTGLAYNISGRVVDEKTKQPLPASRAIISTSDSTIVKAVEADVDGKFVMEGIEIGKYMLKIESATTFPYISALELNEDIDLGEIALSESTELNEIVVNGQRRTTNAEMTTVIPTPTSVKASPTILDLLRLQHLPGLEVNPIMKTISIYGRGLIIKVNGVEKDINYIQSLDPKNVAKIEYSDTPPTRYLELGVQGVIDIILKEKLDGGSVFGNIDACPYTGFLNGYLAGAYNYKNSQFLLSYNTEWRCYDKWTIDYMREYIGPSDGYQRTELFEGIPDKMMYHNNQITANYTYQNNKGLYFTAQFGGYFTKSHRKVSGNTTVNDDDPYKSLTETRSDDFRPTLDLFLSKIWSGNKKLEVNVVGSTTATDYTRDLTYDRNDEVFYSVNNTTDNSSRSLIGEAAYSQPIKNVNWRIGVNESYMHAKNIYTGNQTDRMDRSTTYLYTSLFSSIGRFSYSVGGGLNYKYVKENSESMDYWQARANVSFAYNPTQRSSIKIAANYIPQLPSLSQLTAIQQTHNDIITSTGNKTLKGSHPIYAYISYYLNYKKFSLNAYVSNYYIHNTMITDYEYLGNGQYLSIPVNFDKYNNLTVSANPKFSGIFNHFDIALHVYYSRYELSNGNYSKQLNFFGFGPSIFAYFGNFSAYLWYNRPPKSLQGYSVNTGENSLGIQLRYNYRNFTFGTGLYYPFIKEGTKYRNETSSPLMKGWDYTHIPNNANMLVISVTYRANFGRQFNNQGKGLNNSANDDSMLM